MAKPENLDELTLGLYVGNDEIWKDIDRDVKRIRAEYEYQIYLNQDEPAENDGFRYMR